MLFAVQLTVTEAEHQLKCPSPNQEIIKGSTAYTMEYCVAVESGNLGSIVLTAIHLMLNEKYLMISPRGKI